MTVAEIMGYQMPTAHSLPEGRVGSAGPAAIQLGMMAGIELDPWQQWCLDQLLGERTDVYWNALLDKWMPKSAAYEAALIVGRQNGKGAILEILELAWLFLLGMGAPPNLILHSAHEAATAKEHFQRIEGLIRSTPELYAELGKGGIRIANGEWTITLNTGQRIMFKTRTKGAARGFTIDKLVLDEAADLTSEHTKALIPATSATPDPQIIMTGSAGHKESFHFGLARHRGIKKSDPRLFFAEWAPTLCSPFCERGPRGEHVCPVHDDRANPITWAKANPGLGRRLQMENIESEFRGTPIPEDFDRERLSVGDWPTDGASWSVITEEGWNNCFDPLSRPTQPVTFAIDTTPDKRRSAIVAAASNGEGGIHIEVTAKGDLVDYQDGVHWVVSRAIEINRNQRNAVWVIDKATQAGVYWEPLEKAGLKLIAPTYREYGQACGEFFASIMPIGGSVPDLRHSGQPELTVAVASAAKRDLADKMWAWDIAESGDISCLIAATHAVWGHRKRINKPTPKPMFAWA